MLKIRRDLDLGQEPFDAEHGPELRLQHFERDAPVVPQIAREIHDGHTAATDLALDDVAAAERRGQLPE